MRPTHGGLTMKDPTMTVLLDITVHVHYGFLWFTAVDNPFPQGDPRAGQANGLCAAAIPGTLHMVTGLHTGSVPVRIEAFDVAPVLDDTWEEIVEGSFHAVDRSYQLAAFEEFHDVALPYAGDLRARWSARGMDAARDADTRLEDEPPLDAYLLQLWPAALAPGAVLRQTSAAAAYWHGVARDSAPPPSPEELAQQAAEERSLLEQEQQIREAAARLESWQGRLPSERVMALQQSRANQLGWEDRSLLDVVAELDDDALQGLTAWVCRVACRRAGLEELDWVVPALEALERGAPPPEPFDDTSSAFRRLYAHWEAGAEPGQWVTVARTGDSSRTALAPEAAALDAVVSAKADDPLAATIDALVGAGCSYVDPQPWYDEVRRHLTG
jgi:hypothetical protein